MSGSVRLVKVMKRVVLGAIFAAFFVSNSYAQIGPEGTALATAMKSVFASDWDSAKDHAKPAGQVGEDIIEWHRLRAGDGTFVDYQRFLKRRSDWPGLPLMITKGEASIPQDATADQVITYFATQAPGTGSGALRLAAAFSSQGKGDRARTQIVAGWTSLSLTEKEQAEFLAKYADALKGQHVTRLDMLLWKRKTTEAGAMLPLVSAGHQALANARIGLIKRQDGVTKLINAVPNALGGDAGLAYDRFAWRLSKRLQPEAIEMMRLRSTSADALGQPEKWANRRRSLAREMMREGKAKLAYDLASNHHLTEGDHFSDLEWLSGFIALTDLNDPATALTHFQRFRVAVDTPISLGRAGYWEGRAYDALGQTANAQSAYEFGGEYQTSFYGQLAAEKAGMAMDPSMIGRESYPDFRTMSAAQSSVFQAAELFHKAEHPLLFTRFIRHQAESLTPAERGSLAQFALNQDQTFAALYLAKYAANNGTVLMRPYFPAPKIVGTDLPVARELALAIARRESEFYTASKSPVGARGLMQLMPATGKEMAGKLGLPFTVDRLIDDPNFNAKLGSAYLAQLIDEFGPAIPLVAVGYNAGPSRAHRWSKLFGDPRSPNVDVVDWIEHIPFRETRNYVMRVMESLPIYRARITGKTGPLVSSKDWKGR